jgi:hypothetical protein
LRVRLQEGPPASGPGGTRDVDGFALEALKDHYNRDAPLVHHVLDPNPPPRSQRLRRLGTFYDYIILDGRRITPTQRTLRKNAGSSLIKAVIQGQEFCGVVQSFFRHHQPDIADDTLWAEVIWMEEENLSAVEDDPWSEL